MAIIDVSLSVGQSQATWFPGGYSGFPVLPAGKCYMYWYNGFFGDHVPNNYQILETAQFAQNIASDSMWTSFQAKRYEITQKAQLMITAAVGATNLVGADNAYDHWGRNGKLFPLSVAMTQEAMTKITLPEHGGFSPVLRGVECCQGESARADIVSGAKTKEQYRDEILDLALHYREIWPAIPFHIYMTGTSLINGFAGIAEVRWAQADAARIDPYISVVMENSIAFAERGLIMPDNVHWNQTAKNAAGTIGAFRGLKPDGPIS